MHRISKDDSDFLTNAINKITVHNIDYTVSRTFTTLPGISRQLDVMPVGKGSIYYYDTKESKVASYEVTVNELD